MDGFEKFLLRGNVVDLAVAVVIGAAFTALVSTFAAAFITPLVNLFTGGAGDVRAKFFTLAGAKFPYGEFLQAALTFLITAAVVYFFVVRPLNALMDRFTTEPDVAIETKKCPDCLSAIPIPARRCAFCTVEQLPA